MKLIELVGAIGLCMILATLIITAIAGLYFVAHPGIPEEREEKKARKQRNKEKNKDERN